MEIVKLKFLFASSNLHKHHLHYFSDKNSIIKKFKNIKKNKN